MFLKLLCRHLVAKPSFNASSLRMISTITEGRDYLIKVCGANATFSDHLLRREELKSLLPKTQKELHPRSVDQSRQSITIPLSDSLFREKYLNTNGTIRIGQLLENLDTFAVIISYKHNSSIESSDGRSPYSIVTAMVDELVIYNPKMQSDVDMVMQGVVSWVGKSSMEISMYVFQLDELILDTKFLMVARDPSGSKAAFVHPLKVTSDEEQKMVDEGDRRKLQRIETAKESLFSKAPTVDEMKLVHQLFLSTVSPNSRSFHSRCLPDDSVWMETTKLKNAIVCFPEKRNVHNKVFGGYIMRMACELAWSNAFQFGNCRPRLVGIDDIVFQSPVPIGSLLLMSSQITVVEHPYLLARVRAEKMDSETGGYTTSNVFNFLFSTVESLPKVIPKTYGEAMVYLDGLRIVKQKMERFNESNSNLSKS